MAGLLFIYFLIAGALYFIFWQLPYRLIAGRWPRPRLYTQDEIEELTGRKMTDQGVRDLERKRRKREEKDQAWRARGR